jgi:hypothetical protein
MLVKVGQEVRTDFCRGRVMEIIDGRERKWSPTTYLKLEVTLPERSAGTIQIVRANEVKDIL